MLSQLLCGHYDSDGSHGAHHWVAHSISTYYGIEKKKKKYTKIAGKKTMDTPSELPS